MAQKMSCSSSVNLELISDVTVFGDISMSGWFWIAAGLALCIMELVVISGFFLFLLGVSGLLLGLLVLSGLFPTWPIQAAVFSVLAVISWLVFGKRLQGALGVAKSRADDTKGKEIRVVEEIAPGQLGSGELWGSPWRIKNIDAEVLPAGSECVVVDTEGVTLRVTRKR